MKMIVTWECGACHKFYEGNEDGTNAPIIDGSIFERCECQPKPQPGSHPADDPKVSAARVVDTFTRDHDSGN